jgi:uncharacterized protein YndB with AHSA1/START domain
MLSFKIQVWVTLFSTFKTTVMSKSLIVKHSIKINAAPSRVWEVLTKPEYIRQWDRLPEDFGDYEIHPATLIEWPGQSTMNVVEFDLNRTLKYSLSIPEWKEQGVSHIGYDYSLSIDAEGYTWLGIEVGDFAVLTEADKYYDEYATFGQTASQKIKELAENKFIAL